MDDGYAIHWSVLVDGQGISEGPSPRGGPEVLAICCCCRQIILLTTVTTAEKTTWELPLPWWGPSSLRMGLYPLSTEWAHAKQGVPNHLGRQFDSLLRMEIRR